MTDRIMAIVSLLTLMVFIAIVVGFVRELDLAIVVVLCMSIAAYDFWTSFRDNGKS